MRYLAGGGRAAASASAAWFHERGHNTEIPFRGVLPATLATPGAVASVQAHKAYGRLPLKRDLEAAIICWIVPQVAYERLARPLRQWRLLARCKELGIAEQMGRYQIDLRMGASKKQTLQ